MIIKICSFTENGRLLALKLQDLLCDDIVELCEDNDMREDFIGEAFLQRSPLIFIGACGIAVRLIAPFINNKLTDSPVIVIDELGQFVIPILSGHVGGANKLASLLADKLKAKEVITTATDINSKFAVDLFAKRNGLVITDKSQISRISKKALNNEKISFCINPEIKIANEPLLEADFVEYPPKYDVDILIDFNLDYKNKAMMTLLCKEYVLGIGCKRGTEFESLNEFIKSHLLKALKLDLESVYGIASIDLKKKEYAMVLFAQMYGLLFETYTSNELMLLEGDFTKSDFVLASIGVDNVCERAAMALAGACGELIIKKQADAGMTLAVAKRKIRLIF